MRHEVRTSFLFDEFPFYRNAWTILDDQNRARHFLFIMCDVP